MPPSGDHGRPRPPVLPLSATTPHFRRPTETPFGKIKPVFDGFDLAETSWASDSSFATSAPLYPIPHKTPESKRRRRQELYTPGPAVQDHSPAPPEAPPAPHEDDLFARRLADSGRRTPLGPLPVEQFQGVEPLPPQQIPDSGITAPLNKLKASSRAERARAAGIPVLSTRSIARPSSRVLPPLRRAELPQPRPDPPSSGERPSLVASTSQLPAPRYSPAIPREPAPLVARMSVSSASSQSTPSQPRATTPKIDPSLPAGSPRHQDLRRSVLNQSPHQVTPLGTPSARTPASTASLAPSAATLEGRSELWDLSMATPTTSSDSRSARAHVDLPLTSSKRGKSPREDPTHRPTPPTRANASAEDDSKEAGGILGFLTSLFLNPPAPPPAAPKPAPPVRGPPSSSQPAHARTTTLHRAFGDENRPVAPKARTRKERTQSKPTLSDNVPKLETRPVSRRQPLGEMHGDNVSHAHVPRRKRKEPPSPVKLQPTISTGSTRGSAPPSYTRPSTTTASRSANQPEAKLRNSMRPVSQLTASRPRPVSRVTPFVAQALARMPKPGEGATSAAKPVSISDHERARELAIRMAVFERGGKAELPAPLPEALPSFRNSAPPSKASVRIPGEATRLRAEAQAANKERRDRKAAEEALIAAKEAAIRAEVEAELDRQARQATVFRPNPLPKMYHRR